MSRRSRIAGSDTLAGHRIRARSLVDQVDRAACSEAVVEVDDCHARRAAVEHGQEGCQASDGGAIPDAGRHGNDRSVDKPGYDTGKGPFHSRHHHEHVARMQLWARIQQAVDARHADIAEPCHGAAQGLGRDGSLVGNGGVSAVPALATRMVPTPLCGDGPPTTTIRAAT